MIQPHGGTLINRTLKDAERSIFLESHARSTRIQVTERTLSDLYMISIGGFSPLDGFMVHSDYESVVETMHLPNGLVFSIPITLGVSEDEFKSLKIGSDATLVGPDGEVYAHLDIQDKFRRELKNEALKVYKTVEEIHPGVRKLYSAGEYCLGGPIVFVKNNLKLDFPKYSLTPAQTRAEFEKRNWKTIVGFQTRNPIHRAHEYLTKCALETVDGLFIQPLVGETKADDIPADVRIACYEVLIDKYYKKDRVVLGLLPAAMRYAGPREAILHALVRKNYGCTHFIVGRDHAGVGKYYGRFDSQQIFNEIDPKTFGVTVMKFEHTFFCKACKGMASFKTCPHDGSEHIILSGTKVREKLAAGENLPPEFSRPEVAQLLREWAKRKA